MPKVKRDLEETHVTVVRPTILDIARQLCIQLELPRGLRVEFIGENISTLIHGSTISNRGKDEGTQFSTGDKLKINFKTRPREDSWKRIRNYNRFSPTVFSDPKLKVALYPVYDEQEVDIGFTFRFRDRTKAQKTLNHIRNRIAMLQKNFTHDIQYHYVIPDDHIAVLYYIHQLKENQYGNGETMMDWLGRCMSKKFIVTSNLVGKERTPAIEERQVNLIGAFDELMTPAREKGDNGTTYLFAGTYKFRYNVPISMIMEYPMFVHQQPLPKSVRGQKRNLDLEYLQNSKEYNIDDGLLVHLVDDTNPYYRAEPKSIPVWDEWNVQNVTGDSKLMRLLNIAVQVDPESKVIVDLNTIRYPLTEATKKYVLETRDSINVKGYSPLLIELWEWDEVLEDNLYHVNENLEIIADFEMDPTKNYHVTVTAVTDLYGLDLGTQETIKADPDFGNEIIQFQRPGYVLPEIIPGYVDKDDWEDAVANINGEWVNMWLVANSVIQTHRRVD